MSVLFQNFLYCTYRRCSQNGLLVSARTAMLRTASTNTNDFDLSLPCLIYFIVETPSLLPPLEKYQAYDAFKLEQAFACYVLIYSVHPVINIVICFRKLAVDAVYYRQDNFQGLKLPKKHRLSWFCLVFFPDVLENDGKLQTMEKRLWKTHRYCPF